MRLALDAMGGDDAPRAMVQGAFDYADAHPEHTIIIVGRDQDIQAVIAKDFHGRRPANIHLEHAPEVIGMSEKLKALKERPNDSMNRCAQLVKQDLADAMILCGNTGCSVGAAQLHLALTAGSCSAWYLVISLNGPSSTSPRPSSPSSSVRARHTAS